MEKSPEIAAKNAHTTFFRVARSIPKHLEDKESQLYEWYSRLKGNSFTKLSALYDFMTQLYGSIDKFTPCTKGCSYCCHYPVTIREVEIQFIEQECGIKRLKSMNLASDRHQQMAACPFLKNGGCSIYAYRPFVCRRHVALTKTPHWCHPDRANQVSLTLLQFSEVDRVFDLIVRNTGELTSFDIRQVFGTPS